MMVGSNSVLFSSKKYGSVSSWLQQVTDPLRTLHPAGTPRISPKGTLSGATLKTELNSPGY